MTTTLFYATMNTKIGPLTLVKTEKGVCALENGQMKDLTERSWFQRTFKDTELIDNEHAFDREFKELSAYLDGERHQFTFPVDLIGTPFQQSVWRVLQSIPYGQSLSYGEVARMIGKRPTVSQAVGQAIGQNPVMFVVPCHRVLSQSGELTGYRGGTAMKKALLDLEGVPYRT